MSSKTEVSSYSLIPQNLRTAPAHFLPCCTLYAEMRKKRKEIVHVGLAL